MLKKIAALVLVALFAMVPFAPQAGAQSYGPKLPTQTHVVFVKAVVGKPLVVRLSVTASDGTSPAGDIAYTISDARGAARARLVARAASSGTVHVSGSPVTVTGPVARPGTYVAAASFTPDNSARYLPSSNSTSVTVGRAAGGGSDNGGAPGGGLPNTGGPDLGWLLAGFGLVGAGAGAIALARRRTPATA